MMRKKRLFRMTGLILVISLTCGSCVFANTQSKGGDMTFAEAKDYLQNYEETAVNEEGKTYTIHYQFDTEEDLNKMASYITKYGLEAFNQKIDAQVSKHGGTVDSKSTEPKTANPPIINKIVRGNGTHTVKGEVYGLARFKSLGKIEYTAKLSYKAVVKNGKITNINDISFDIPYISNTGSWGKVKFTKIVNNSIIATGKVEYTIYKTLSVSVGGGSANLKTEECVESFSIVTTVGK